GAYHGGGLEGLALGQGEERQARLAGVPVGDRAPERLRRLVVVAEPQPDLADLVVGEADGVEHVEALELAARLHRLALRLLPGAVQALQLGPVHAALAAVSLDRAHPHPAVGLVDPLAGATVLAEVREG